jgi:hypothetical protein
MDYGSVKSRNLWLILSRVGSQKRQCLAYLPQIAIHGKSSASADMLRGMDFKAPG